MFVNIGIAILIISFGMTTLTASLYRRWKFQYFLVDFIDNTLLVVTGLMMLGGALFAAEAIALEIDMEPIILQSVLMIAMLRIFFRLKSTGEGNRPKMPTRI